MIGKKYFIRCDSSSEIGIGHTIRCFSLAEILRDMKCKVEFMCKKLDGNIINFLKEKKFKVFILESDDDVKKILKDNLESTLIIDNYDIDEKWEQMMRPYVKKIIVIDDLANRKHDCELLLDQNFSGVKVDKYDRLVPEHCVRLFGPKFALLRKEFVENRKRKSFNNPIKNIFVSYGGTDPTDETSKILDAIKNIKNENLKVNVVVGDSNIEKDKIRKLCLSISNVNFISKYDNISKTMNETDIAFGAGGSSMWERMCLGIPSIVTIVSDDQVAATEALSENQYIINMGLAENITSQDYEHILREINDKELYKISKKCYELVDGKGASRTAEKIISLEDT